MGAASSRSPSPQTQDRDLVAAAERGDSEGLVLLLESGARPNKAWKRVVLRARVSAGGGRTEASDERDCETPLAAAIIKGREDVVRGLLRGGADPNARQEWCIAGHKRGGNAWSTHEWETRRWPVRYEYSCALALALGRGADVTDKLNSLGKSVARFISREPSLQDLADRGCVRINHEGPTVVLDNPKSSNDTSKLVRIVPNIGIVRALLDGGAQVTDEILRLSTQIPDRRFVEAFEQHLVQESIRRSDEEKKSSAHGPRMVVKIVVVIRKPWLREEKEGLMKLNLGQKIFCVREYPDGRGYGRNLSTNRYDYFALSCVKDFKPELRTKTWPILNLPRSVSRISETPGSRLSVPSGTYEPPTSTAGGATPDDRLSSRLSRRWSNLNLSASFRHSVDGSITVPPALPAGAVTSAADGTQSARSSLEHALSPAPIARPGSRTSTYSNRKSALLSSIALPLPRPWSRQSIEGISMFSPTISPPPIPRSSPPLNLVSPAPNPGGEPDPAEELVRVPRRMHSLTHVLPEYIGENPAGTAGPERHHTRARTRSRSRSPESLRQAQLMGMHRMAVKSFATDASRDSTLHDCFRSTHTYSLGGSDAVDVDGDGDGGSIFTPQPVKHGVLSKRVTFSCKTDVDLDVGMLESSDSAVTVTSVKERERDAVEESSLFGDAEKRAMNVIPVLEVTAPEVC
ncbi:hypothetical protein M427DRAFT_302323 [Gonapodya prolifera JEL478]|uniref:Uncharacterized protein n=1 Tax=Gonapodya prolifera (strain JEL478) TaxID=1344416 RepID=A0A139AH87_GONPJ|nr:hypothetical protein M427DRAFT_302323 [Gonapodya prolifera JEL478]|eukprot:KXS16182.1 hypothetical protein M427DRAFT_302323 [Gonapodya prolifera JEL478]